VAVVVIVLVIVVALAASGAFTPKNSGNGNGGGGGGGPTTAYHTETITKTSGGAIGAGPSAASVYPFTVPSNALSANVQGNLSVTTCSSSGNCLAFIGVITASQWSNYVAGGTATFLYCYVGLGSTCTAEQNVQMQSGNLTGEAGQSLDVVVWNSDTLFSQQGTWDAELHYTTNS
jgi:hypothetical protein